MPMISSRYSFENVSRSKSLNLQTMKVQFRKTLQRCLLCCQVTLLFLAISCGDDDAPDPRDRFIGTYEVEEFIPPSATVYKTYEITISKSGKDMEIGNFPAFYVPWRATANGNTLTIPAQSFTQGSATLTVSGSGVFEDDKIGLSYELSGFASYSRECIAVKK